MAVKLRLTRRGKKKQPTYRVVAADSRFPRDGRFIEILGFYDPRQEPSEIRIDSDKALKWLRDGAQPSARVKKLLEISGIWSQFAGKITLTESAKNIAPENPQPENPQPEQEPKAEEKPQEQEEQEEPKQEEPKNE